jgi:Schlafen, AlbA_2
LSACCSLRSYPALILVPIRSRSDPNHERDRSSDKQELTDTLMITEDDEPVTSTQSLLYSAESDVTIERVRALVRQVGPESPTVEYKGQMADTIAKGVAALANTYGGLLLVGVTDGRVVKGVKEKAIESVAEHCAAKIEPPWVPEIIPVPLGQGSDLYVLMLRVVPGSHPRPLLVDGVAYVRHQNTSHPADWQRLRDLFTESSAASQDDAWTIRRPDMPRGADGTSDETVDFVLRSGLDFAVAREAKWRPLAERTVTAFTDALNQSPLNSVLRSLSLGNARSGGLNPFHRQGLNRSRTVRLAWWGVPDGWPADTPAPVEASARLEVPGGYGQTAQNLQVEIDVVVRCSAVAKVAHQGSAAGQQIQLPRWRVTAQQLGRLIDAMLATLTGKDVAGPLADLAGIAVEAVPQPHILHMVTGQPVTEVLDTTGLHLIPDGGISMGAHLLADPALDLAANDDRRDQVRTWLAQIALDAGLLGMEQVLERLAATNV